MPVVKCVMCKTVDMHITTDELRALVDANRLPVCSKHDVHTRDRVYSHRYDSMTVKAAILLSLYRAGGQAHVDDIVVAAWHLLPDRLSLGKYSSHPDSHRVYMDLVKLRHEVERIAPSVYKLTPVGLYRAVQVADYVERSSARARA